jgi:hypothetical protein
MLVGSSLSVRRSPLTSSLRRHSVYVTKREHRVTDVQLAAAERFGSNLGRHMGHTAKPRVAEVLTPKPPVGRSTTWRTHRRRWSAQVAKG